MMAMMKFFLQLTPRSFRRRAGARPLGKKRLEAGKTHAAIEMNLENLLICMKNCGTCPSYPGNEMEALFCASGKSDSEIIQNGCNCVSCPLYDLCSSNNTAYFCKNGGCAAPGEKEDNSSDSKDCNSYLSQFIGKSSPEKSAFEEVSTSSEITEKAVDFTMDFINDKEIHTKSDVPILKASLDGGIDHTHVCGGRARCSTCRVIVTDGVEHCRPRNEKEARLAAIKGFSDDVRLACQTTVEDDIRLRRLVHDDEDIASAIKEGRGSVNDAGHEIEATILFSDIRSFTSFSERSLPYDIVHILNRYFDAIGGMIDANKGYIDKYMGDGIMAIFGLDETSDENPAYQAVKAACDMAEALKEFNSYLESRFDHEFRIGIGVHTGKVIVGNLGYRKKKEFTAIGDTVNTASRIESLNKETGSSILVSQQTFDLVKNDFKWKNKYKSKVKGKAEPVIVFEPEFT